MMITHTNITEFLMDKNERLHTIDHDGVIHGKGEVLIPHRIKSNTQKNAESKNQPDTLFECGFVQISFK